MRHYDGVLQQLYSRGRIGWRTYRMGGPDCTRTLGFTQYLVLSLKSVAVGSSHLVIHLRLGSLKSALKCVRCEMPSPPVASCLLDDLLLLDIQ